MLAFNSGPRSRYSLFRFRSGILLGIICLILQSFLPCFWVEYFIVPFYSPFSSSSSLHAVLLCSSEDSFNQHRYPNKCICMVSLLQTNAESGEWNSGSEYLLSFYNSLGSMLSITHTTHNTCIHTECVYMCV